MVEFNKKWMVDLINKNTEVTINSMNLPLISTSYTAVRYWGMETDIQVYSNQ